MKRAKMPQSIRTSPGTDAEILSSELATPEHSEGPSNTGTVTAPTEKPWLIRQPIDPAIRAHIADRLAQDPLINYSELALEVGVGKDVVSQVARKLNGADDDLADRRLKSFQRQIGKELPMKDRVMIYGEIARGKANPKAAFSQAAVLKRIEELEGIVTRKEQREVADNSVPVLPPMFVLKDADVDIGMVVKIRSKKGTR